MEHHRGVLASLDDLVEVADRTVAHSARQRAVHPFGIAAAKEKPANEIRGSQVVMARHCDEWAIQVMRHRLDESRLTASGRPLQDHGEALVKRRLEHLLLVG